MLIHIIYSIMVVKENTKKLNIQNSPVHKNRSTIRKPYIKFSTKIVNPKHEKMPNLSSDKQLPEPITSNSVQQNRPQFLTGFLKQNFVVLDADDTFKYQTQEHAIVASYADDNSLHVYGFFTSWKAGNADGKVYNLKLSPVKFDSTYTPLILKKPKFMDNYGLPVKSEFPGKPVIDNYGDPFPDPKRGGQYFMALDTKLIISPDELHKLNFIRDPISTNYLNSNEIMQTLVWDFICQTQNALSHRRVFSQETFAELYTFYVKFI